MATGSGPLSFLFTRASRSLEDSDNDDDDDNDSDDDDGGNNGTYQVPGLSPSQGPCQVGAIIPILQMKEFKARELSDCKVSPT